MSDDASLVFPIPTPPKVLRKKEEEEEKKKKEIWMFSKSLDLDGNKITNSIHWYAPKKQNELPNMEDALISNFHTHKLHYNTIFLTLLLPIFNSNFYRFLLYTYYLQKASIDHIFKILVQLLLTVSNPKNLANISKCLFTHFYSFV